MIKAVTESLAPRRPMAVRGMGLHSMKRKATSNTMLPQRMRKCKERFRGLSVNVRE